MGRERRAGSGLAASRAAAADPLARSRAQMIWPQSFWPQGAIRTLALRQSQADA